MVWTTAFNVFRDVLQFGVMLVLVRIIAPEAYGQFNLTNAVIGCAMVLSFGTFLGHTLQVRNDDEVDYQLHFTAGAGLQIALFVLTNLFALGCRLSDTLSAVAPLIHVMSVTFLLEWPTELRRKMLERQLRWKRLQLLHGVGLVMSSVTALVMAVAGAGVYALLIPGLLVTAPFIYDLFFVEQWRPTWRFDPSAYRPAFRFGIARLGSGLLDRGRQLVESGLIVRIIGYGGLGFFGRAVGLGQMLCSRFAFQLTYALYPVLTKLEPGSPAYRRGAGLVLRTTAWAVIPLVVLFALFADPVVRTIYGERWLAVTPLLPLALAMIGLGSLYHVAYMLLLAHLRAGTCVMLDMLQFVGCVAALVLFLPAGLQAYLTGMAGLSLILLLTSMWMLVADRAIQLRGIADALGAPVVATLAALVICVRILNGGTPASGIDGIRLPLVAASAFGVVYLIVLRLGFSRQLGELVSFFPGSSRLLGILRLPRLAQLA